MQLAGIGFTGQNWNTLIKQLQKYLSFQLSCKLYGDSDSEQVRLSNASVDLVDKIVKQNPDWVMFSPREFESAEILLDFLNEVQNESDKNVSCAMAIAENNEEFAPLLKLHPEFELVNKMRFNISKPELLLNHHIPRFPRIRLDSDFQIIEYTDHSGTLVRHTPDDIPVNTLIPFKNIQKVQSNTIQLSPQKWLQILMSDKGNIADADQVVGILRETKGCYLFPGIPFNSIQNITIGQTRVEHLIRMDELTIKNPPFKRFIASLNREHGGGLKQKKQTKQNSPQILCFSKFPAISSLLKNILKGSGYKHVVSISDLNQNNDLKDSAVLLKLNDFRDTDLADSDFKGQIIDWSKEIYNILEPLSQFVYLNDLKIGGSSQLLPIQQDELEGLREKLLRKEKKAATLNMYAESDQLLYSQEFDVLKKIEPFSKLLSSALSKSTNWESAAEEAPGIKFPRVLLLCEDEKAASEMNFKLTHVQRKLWVNPYKLQKPEDLTQLNSKMIRSYLSPGSLIVKAAARKHLEKICLQTQQEKKKAENDFNRHKMILKKAKDDLKMIENKKNELALRWLHVSLKDLIFRDLHLLNTVSGAAE
jgi:hypothetical protein